MADVPTKPGSKLSRRGFLTLASLGLGAAAALAWPLRGSLFKGRGSGSEDGEFPGEDSIFHPRRDPRKVARERGTRNS